MKTFEKENLISPDLGVMKCEDFNRCYASLNKWMLSEAGTVQSRNGDTVEILNFKTILTNPLRRCVGVDKRNINIFFLLAEAMWIFVGKKDVEFLNIFNSNMASFSDDGVVFHAPYGFRIRHWGVPSEGKYTSETLHAAQGFDQLSDIIKLLHQTPETRQAVISIWNPDYDLGVQSKDIPCNDMLMFKIREGKLHTTVQNRSNDLHWGLPTNIFQFSFLSESMAACLGVEVGTQVHNSQSLHIYGWNETAKVMNDNFGTASLYDNEKVTHMKMDFKFSHDLPSNRLRELDYFYNNIISNLTNYYRGGKKNEMFIEELRNFSYYLFNVYELLSIYIDYKNKVIDKQVAFDAISNIKIDFVVLAKNFFASRLGFTDSDGFIGNL